MKYFFRENVIKCNVKKTRVREGTSQSQMQIPGEIIRKAEFFLEGRGERVRVTI